MNHLIILSKQRKFVESYGISSLIEKLQQRNESSEKILYDIEKSLSEYKDARNTRPNSWYWDYKFHQSLYQSLSVNCTVNNRILSNFIEKDFQKIYFTLKIFFGTYQTDFTQDDHKKIYDYLKKQQYELATSSLIQHIDNAIKDASFWIKYVNELCKKFLPQENFNLVGEFPHNCEEEFIEDEEHLQKVKEHLQKVEEQLQEGIPVLLLFSLESEKFGYC